MSIKIFTFICLAIAFICNLTIVFVKHPVKRPKKEATILKYASLMTAVLLVIIIGILIEVGFFF